MKKILITTLAALLAIFAAACSTAEKTAPTPTANTATAATPAHKADDEIPATVRAAFPDAQTFTKQHKDITAAQKADIEKESGGAAPDTDHHSYLAFSTAGGARKQLGAATLVKAGGKELVVVYESKDGQPVIKEVRAEGLEPAFLGKFKGQGHHDNFAALKLTGADEAVGKAIWVDMQTMNALYGGSHTH